MRPGHPHQITYRPLSRDNWDDLVSLFDGHGNPGYCWCTFWRLSSTQYRQCSSGERRQALNALVCEDIPTGILGYRDGEVIGWCSIAPRETYERLNRSRTIPRIDDRATWSLACFYIRKDEQGKGLSLEFVRAAVDLAASHHAEVVEAYPVEPEIDADGQWHPAKSYSFMGYRSTFERAGFQEVTPGGAKRIIMRLEINGR